MERHEGIIWFAVRSLPIVIVLLACGPSDGSDAAGSGDATSGGEAGVMQMRDRSSGPTSDDDFGRLEATGSGNSVATDRHERESRPNIDVSDPASRRESELPLTPSQADRRRIFNRLRRDMRRCLRGLHVSFTVRVRVESSGVVREALVQGEHIEGTEKAHCVEAALRDTMFPAFRDPETTIRHDYRF